MAARPSLTELSSEVKHTIQNCYSSTQSVIEACIRECMLQFPSLRPGVSKLNVRGTSLSLVYLSGTLPIPARSSSKHHSERLLPVEVWLLEDFPVVPPLCYLSSQNDLTKSLISILDPSGCVQTDKIVNWDVRLVESPRCLAEFLSRICDLLAQSTGSAPAEGFSSSPSSLRNNSHSGSFLNGTSLLGTNGPLNYAHGPAEIPPEEITRLALLQQLHDKALSRLTSSPEGVSFIFVGEENNVLREHNANLASLVAVAESEHRRMAEAIKEGETAAGKLKEAIATAPASLDVDELGAGFPLHEQALSLIAEEDAINEAIRELTQRLHAHELEWSSYSRVVDQLSRRLYLISVLLNRVRQKLSLRVP